MSQYVGGTGAAQMRILAGDLAKVPQELRRAARARIKVAGEAILRQGQANASWSSRIPGAMSIQVSFAGRNPGVTIVVNTARAPHARPFEGIVAPTWRHPVFERSGRPTPWVAQAARPYLLPAVDAGHDLAVEGISAAVDEVLTSAGFR